MATIQFTGWAYDQGFYGVAFVKLLMAAGYQLKEAKELMDLVNLNIPVTIIVPPETEAELILQKARLLGAIGHLL